MNMRGRATSMTTATNWFVVGTIQKCSVKGCLIAMQNFWFALYIPTAMNKIRYV
jgi:hypothetical protein